MQISDKLNRAKVSGTAHLAQVARDLKHAGRDIIELAEGEPDFDTQGFIIDAAMAAARRGETRYTSVAGTTELRQAVAELCESRGIRLKLVPISLCTDNAAMIAAAATHTEPIAWPGYLDFDAFATGRRS